MTLLALLIDPNRHALQWVRAGHDPGMLYRLSADRFEELGGPGMALGVDSNWSYTVQKAEGLQAGDIVLLGTDGIWEARNCDGIMFGKKKVRAIIREQRDHAAGAILEAIFDAVASYTCETKLADDMTLIVVKIISRGNDGYGKHYLG
jgi:sigma-B regulation protein RsbU (phosphoserine phosphatase)